MAKGISHVGPDNHSILPMHSGRSICYFCMYPKNEDRVEEVENGILKPKFKMNASRK